MVPQTFNPIPHIGAAVKAAAPDVIKGGMKAGVGLTLAQEAPGMLKWPARGMLGYPGLRQMYKGMRAGGSALGGGTTEEALAALPEYKGGITNPEAAKMPAVFGDPQGFSKLPQSVQDAILKGQGNITQPKATAGPLPPRSREDYLGPDAPRPNTVTIHPEAGDLRIKSPQPAPAGTIPVPKPTVEGAVTKLDMPAHEPYESFSPSRVERQTTPAETVPARAEYEARVGRLKKAFPLESDQQIRTRADRAIIDKKLGAAGLKKQDFQSMGGK
jgi:hypothetical protein